MNYIDSRLHKQCLAALKANQTLGWFLGKMTVAQTVTVRYPLFDVKIWPKVNYFAGASAIFIGTSASCINFFVKKY